MFVFKKLNLALLGTVREKAESRMACRPYSEAVEFCWVQADLMSRVGHGDSQLSVLLAHLFLCRSSNPLLLGKRMYGLLTITASHRPEWKVVRD